MTNIHNTAITAKLKMKAAHAQLRDLLQSDLEMSSVQYWNAFREIQRLIRSARVDIDQVSGVPVRRAACVK